MTTMYETSDLHKRVERYESAVDELRAAHQDIRTVLVDQLLYERWQQIGAELGFAADRSDYLPGPQPDHGDRPSPGGQPSSAFGALPAMTESWAG